MSVEKALSFKEEGNKLFSTHGDVVGAINAYRSGIALLENECTPSKSATEQYDKEQLEQELRQHKEQEMKEELEDEEDKKTTTKSFDNSNNAIERESLLITLYCNLANAFVETGEYDKAEEAAKKAIALNPEAIKPWIRFIDARRRNGFPFDALVQYWLYLRPVLRSHSLEESNSSSSNNNSKSKKESDNNNKRKATNSLSFSKSEKGKRSQELASLRELCITSIERPLYETLGLERVVQDVELIEYMGGVAMVARRSFKPNEVLFVEHKYHTSGMEEMSFDLERALNTESVVLHFAQFLRPHQLARSSLWQRFSHDFIGAWPRKLSEVDDETQRKVGGVLFEAFPELRTSLNISLRDSITISETNGSSNNTSNNEYNELLMFSLICRYNCFYSGFFRTCALANHSCRANIAMKYNHALQTVTMLTVSHIAPGELMNVKYLSDLHFLMGRGKRREYLRSWLFWCYCDRCQEDCHQNAVQEHIRCPSCQYYTHAAFPSKEQSPEWSENVNNCNSEDNNVMKLNNEESNTSKQYNQEEEWEEYIEENKLHETTSYESNNQAKNDNNTTDADIYNNNNNNNLNNKCNTLNKFTHKTEKCVHCAAHVTWTKERINQVDELLAYLTNYMEKEHTIIALGRQLHEQLSLVRKIDVHPCNWIYRIVFFYYCIPLNSKLNAIFESLHYNRTRVSARVDGSSLVMIKDVLSSFNLEEVYLNLLIEAKDKWYAVTSNNTISNNVQNVYENDKSKSNSKESKFICDGESDATLAIISCNSNNNNNNNINNNESDKIKAMSSDAHNLFTLSLLTDNLIMTNVAQESSNAISDSVYDRNSNCLSQEYQREVFSGEQWQCSDALMVFLIEWHLIADFYPPYEMWAIHHAICELLLLQLLFAQPSSSTTTATATATAKTNNIDTSTSKTNNTIVNINMIVRILQQHGPYLEQHEVDSWFAIFNAYKSHSVIAKQVAQHIGKLKQAFKGK